MADSQKVALKKIELANIVETSMKAHGYETRRTSNTEVSVIIRGEGRVVDHWFTIKVKETI